jgi:Family of unknown function (DUF5662)
MDDPGRATYEAFRQLSPLARRLVMPPWEGVPPQEQAAWAGVAQAEPGRYDSRADTLLHSQRVGELIGAVVKDLLGRASCHDRSKTQPPEVEVFDEFTPQLKTLTYGSDEYAASLTAMGGGLAHHYAVNRHHPEHFPDGIAGMTLVDVVEMLADWKAATERVRDGDLGRSLDIQQDRFSISADLTAILRNTAEHLGWL